MDRSTIFLLFFACTIVNAASLKNNYAHFLSMDEEENYLMYWTTNDIEQTMDFAISVKTSGWVGFGFSPYTGRMPGSDTIIGWVANGKAYLQDRFAPSHTVPVLDAQQDYTLISGEENNGMTILKFSRKYDTGDSKDLLIDTGTTRLIWAYNDNDPVDPQTFTKHTKQGSRSVNLFNSLPEADKPPLPSDTQYFDLLNPDVAIPSGDTTYWCTAFKLPEVNGTAHMIKIDPIIQKGHSGLVHHILVYDCVFDEKFHGSSHDCDSRNMPQGLRGCRGATVIGAWAVGAEGLSYPAHVGLPLGGDKGARYVVMETHYDNPNREAGLRDSSGMRFYYTHQLRQYDAGVFEIGQATSPFMVIPEGQTQWEVAGYCSENCTRPNLPSTGIKFFGGFLHTHLAGYSIVTKHYRNGVELPEMLSNRHYDFNYQETSFLKKEVTFLPGDQLTLICTYNTAKRPKVTVGGIATRDEMCLAYLLYYPKVDLSVCFSSNNYIHYLNYFQTLKEAGLTPPYNKYPSKPPYAWNVIRNSTIGKGIHLKNLYELDNSVKPQQYCAARNHVLLQPSGQMDIPKYVKYHTNQRLQNSFTETTTGAASKTHFSVLLMCILPLFAYLLARQF
ncbi:expressed hypothetical protein [Trichoplax adhaerens]|uniref:DOMON domain-containing protein n=1 Tax=Trichoplax adhaerens TaxID=10228 RepID=B3RUZ5_TRIAD|nr:expressed hypothetical protein [Trichoplax adhaerens]EDV25405.1 expressed hypothetical protein [Trichoplax adhaerens]|eukprot:XP_002111438.1 expressed hypothetical protein [Trichoplax adhaerens]